MSDWFEAERHVEKAHELYEAGRWDDAATELREALALNPYRAEWHFNLGLTLEAAGRSRDAADSFQRASELEPEDVQAPLGVGVNMLRSEDLERAIEWFERVERLEPTRIDSYVHRIEAYARLGDHERAETMFYLAQEIDSEHAGALANVAESLLDRELLEKAIWCLREAARIDSSMPRLHARLADAYARTGQREKAYQLYLRELREHPGCVDTLLDLGCLLVDMHRYTEASEKLRRVLELEQDNPDAHYYLADLAERRGRIAEAVSSFKIVVGLDPAYDGARVRLAALLASGGSVAEARRWLRQEVEAFTSAPDSMDDERLGELGRLLLDVQLPSDAARVFDALARRSPGDAETRHLLSVAHFEAGDRPTGRRACMQAICLDEEHVTAMHNLALAAIEDRRWRRARRWVRRALLVDPDDTDLRRLRTLLGLQRLWAGSVSALRGLVGRKRLAAR